ncbi:macrophage mannose receptor 1-like [Dreissena polymorpha]|nr:macrophage mannose receptor 1-like [Dreissena polymorpha]
MAHLLQVIISILITSQYVFCQKCPFNWYAQSDTSSKCYRAFLTDLRSWEDARSLCSIHGGDFLKIESQQEMVWIFGQLQNLVITNRTLNGSSWWIGLNNKQVASTWAWADNSNVANFVTSNWAPGSPAASDSKHCGLVGLQNKFTNDNCTAPHHWICNKDRGAPMTCDADNNWQSLNGACYKVFQAKNTYNQSKSTCNRYNADLTTVDDPNVEMLLSDFAVNNKLSMWIGLEASGTGPSWTWKWYNGSTPTATFWNTSSPPGNSQGSCAVLSYTLPYQSAWIPAQCTDRNGFVCRKPQGTCVPGWIGHRTTCYQFNIHYKLSFLDATLFCSQQGGQLLKISSDADQAFINTYLDEIRDSEINSFWIGASDDNGTNNGMIKWRDGTFLTYKHWNNGHPVKLPGKQDCADIQTQDTAGFWRMSHDCSQVKPFVCQIGTGLPVKPLASTPPPRYGCPQGWAQAKDVCVKVGDRQFTWSQARAACQNMSTGADLALISRQDIQSKINGLTNRATNYWIGLNDRAVDGTYIWNDGQIQFQAAQYANWKPGQPDNANFVQNCVALDHQQWNDFDCSRAKQFVCTKIADSIFPSPPPTTPATDWSVKCGPGWDSNPLSPFCYMFVDQPLSWTDAQTECRNHQSDLLSIETVQEQAYIAGRLSSLNSIAVWTGANDRSTEGGWKWSNSQPFAYLNWAPGQPAATNGQGTDCVAMLTSSALWDDVDCTSRNGYVCEKPGNLPTAPPTPAPTISVPAGMVLGCNVGWLPYKNNCYRIIRNPSTWQDAQITCGRNGGTLASILDQNEQNFIQGNLPKPVLSWDGLWIGLNDIAADNFFVWSDGQTVTYTNWNVNEPNDFSNRNEDCVEMRLDAGRWNDEVCSMVRPGMICKTSKTAVSATQAPYQIGCPLNSIGFGQFCYKKSYNQALSFDAANTACARQLNGTLATVYGRILQAFLSSNLLVYTHGYYWIGLSDRARAGTYAWSDGSALAYTNWVNTHTGNERSTCVSMQSDGIPGLWLNQQCNQSNQFICQFPRQGFPLPTTARTTLSNLPCPSGWLANGPNCLKAFAAQNTSRNWMQARIYCQGLGGDLPSFHSNYNDSILATLLAKYNRSMFWIGLNDRGREGGYVWSDGSAVDYTNWADKQPDNFNNNQDCVQVVPSLKWNDQTCYAVTKFICAIPRGTILTPATTLPTGITSSVCGANWLLYNNSCYSTSPDTGDNSTVSWYDAQTYCNAQGSNLASIHDVNEKNFLTSMVLNFTKKEYWLGLNALDNIGFKWVDTSAVDYVNWAPTEPNDFYGMEKCVTMFRLNGLWNDQNCNRPQGFVCKKPASGAALIVSPTPFPSGGCSNGFTRAPGGRNKCFLIGGVQQSARLNYTDAVKFCRKFGTGYDIASIEDQFEQQFVILMSKGQRNSMWIGLTDRFQNNKFLWQDQSPLIYTNWDVGEPTSRSENPQQKGVQNCVLMRMYKPGFEGRWADTECSQPMGFICQTSQDPSIVVTTPSSNCGVGYSRFQSSCYKASASSDSRTWSNAQVACQADGGGNLVSITSVYESAFVHSLVLQNYSYWIGLSDSKVKGVYGWVDGWPVVYTNWGWQEPSYGLNGSGCVISNNKGKWNDTDCNRLMRYVCEITTAAPPTTPPPSNKCQQTGWIINGGYCYSAFVNTGRSWPEAARECHKQGGYLASVHSQQEMTFIFNLVAQTNVTNSHYKPNIWIGLEQGGQAGYTWTDGTAINFVSWNAGEPSLLGSHGQTEECVEFDRNTGKWNDIDCYTNRGYVCKSSQVMPTSGYATSPGQFIGNGNDSIPIYIAPTGPIAPRPGQGVTQLPYFTNPGIPLGSPGPKQPLQQQGPVVQNQTQSSGMQTGSIVGIIVGCLIAVVLVGVGLIELKRRGIVRPPAVTAQEGGLGFANVLYDKKDGVTLDSES